MMGSGKSTVGQVLAQKLDRNYIDLDAEIKAAAGKSLTAIFDHEGERHFRGLESEALKAVSEKMNNVIATGGGIILDENNSRLMRETGTVIFLDTDVDTLARRLEKTIDRPLLENENKKSRLKSLWNKREALYRATAHFTLDSNLAADTCAKKIMAGLKYVSMQNPVPE